VDATTRDEFSGTEASTPPLYYSSIYAYVAFFYGFRRARSGGKSLEGLVDKKIMRLERETRCVYIKQLLILSSWK
jgi:hypothetical protein